MFRFLVAAAVALPLMILLLPVFIVAGALVLFANCVRALAHLLEPRFVPWADLMMFDATLGWKPRPDVDARYLAERDDVFRVVTDGEGWPGSGSVESSALVVIGDSFAFGYGVDTGSSFADLTRGVSIKGVGAPGYSMVHGVLLMEQLAKRLAGKFVVWFVCLENDLEDNLSPAMWRYRSPFVRRAHNGGSWEIVDAHVSPKPWECAPFGVKRIFPHLCVPGPLADRVYGASDYLIGRASAVCERIGARLVLVTIPDPIQLTDAGRARLAALSGNPELCDADLPDRRIAESCSRYGVPIIVGKDHLSSRDYKRIEAIHWNDRGHRRMAELLDRMYRLYVSGTPATAWAARPLADDRIATLQQSAAGLQLNLTRAAND
jgi:hypothetical protein